MTKQKIILSLCLAVLVGTSSYEGYLIYSLKKTGTLKEQAYAEAEASSTARITTLNESLAETQTMLQDMADQSAQLSNTLKAEQDRNNQFATQISTIGSKVGTLDKLASTDPELLKKYSKISFLNENYMPTKLVPLDKQYLYDNTQPKFFLADAEPFLIRMMIDASNQGVKLWVISAFRSFDEQKDLKDQYTVVYGTGANSFSADQGYSEHQLGTAVDLTTEGLNGGFEGFDETNAYKWLQANAYRYGFELSYPHNNTYYVFEPWHWRFVGPTLATYLHENNTYFYALDQRTIDTYLISLFD